MDIRDYLPYQASRQEDARGHYFVSTVEFHHAEGAHMSVAESVPEPRQLMSEAEMDSAIEEMAKQIIKAGGEQLNLMLVGIRTRGVPLAHWLAKKIKKLSGTDVPVGTLDINLYRDDLSEFDKHPVVRQTELPQPIAGKGIVLVDDVLFTGRTIRSALDAIVDFGRPQYVQLAVLVDRGWRELPIQADYVGKSLKTSLQENVKVMLADCDGENRVMVRVQQ
jgi:pyrimidine operon attenuation protein / uracil phosphoribosyltransferase